MSDETRVHEPGRVFAPTGCFVAFEGGEGSGKSTQARRLRQWLSSEGYDVVLTHQPGDTEVGQKLRRIVLDPATGEINGRTETLIYLADKAEHVDRVVWPALRRGAVVVCDRFVDSTLAYQGAGRTLTSDELHRISWWSVDDLRPHLTVLLDVEPESGLRRFRERDRIEAEAMDFHLRVREEYLSLAETDPDHYLVIDGHESVDAIETTIRAAVEKLLGGVNKSGGAGLIEALPPTGVSDPGL